MLFLTWILPACFFASVVNALSDPSIASLVDAINNNTNLTLFNIALANANLTSPVTTVTEATFSDVRNGRLVPGKDAWPARGLAFNDPPAYIKNFNGAGSQVNWAYNWDSDMPQDFPAYLEFVPMLWGDADALTSKWDANVNDALGRRSGHLMSFNEPDSCIDGGSCMTVPQAVAAYRKYMMPYAGRAQLGSPAVTNGPNGFNWLIKFLTACTGCRIDFVPDHWYNDASNTGYLYNYIIQTQIIAKNYANSVPIWLTEFRAAGSEADRETFLKIVLPWMDQATLIYRHAWFSALPNIDGALVDGNGNPTALGNLYAYTPY